MTYYYTYYSYEEWGRGYIGSKPSGCTCLPEEDPYMGSFTDKTFRPTQKIILGVYYSPEECLSAEVELHEFFDVAKNSHFANRSKQTSTGYTRAGVKDEESTRRKKTEARLKDHEINTSRREQTRELGVAQGGKSFREKTGLFAPGVINKETPSKGGSVSGGNNVVSGHLDRIRTFDSCSKGGKTSGKLALERGEGIFSKEGREKSAESARTSGLEKWMDPDHPELGQHNPGNLVKKQKKNGYPHGKSNRVKVFISMQQL